MKILVTGACGFVGSSIIRSLLEFAPGLEITGIDCFIRAGSETNRPVLARMGVRVLHADIRNADISGIQAFPDADVVVGGYPCQSFSMAGNRDPEKDERTSLYKQFLRVVGVVQPKYFVAENVSGLKQLSSGTFLKEQLDAYNKAGYHVTYKLVNAKDYGVPQSRKRLFIVGVRKEIQHPV